MKPRALALLAALLAAPPVHAQITAEAPARPSFARDEEEDFDALGEGFYRLSTGAFVLSNAGLMYLSLRPGPSPRLARVWGGLAMAGGALQAVAGAGGWSDGDTRPLGALNVGFGAATMVIGARTLLRADAGNPLQRRVRLSSGRGALLAATPLATGGVGLAATLRF